MNDFKIKIKSAKSVINMLLIVMIILNIFSAAITKNIQAFFGWTVALLYVVSDFVENK